MATLSEFRAANKNISNLLQKKIGKPEQTFRSPPKVSAKIRSCFYRVFLSFEKVPSQKLATSLKPSDLNSDGNSEDKKSISAASAAFFRRRKKCTYVDGCTQPLSLKPSVTPHPSSGGAQTFTSLRNSTHVALSARTPLSNFVNLEIHPPIWRGNVPRKLGGLKVNGLIVGFKNNVWYGATSQHFVQDLCII